VGNAPKSNEELILGKALTSEAPRVAVTPPALPRAQEDESDETNAYGEAFSPKRFTAEAHDWTGETFRKEAPSASPPPPPMSSLAAGNATIANYSDSPVTQPGGGYNPEQTKVSSVPPELLQASSQRMEAAPEAQASRTLPPVASAVPAMAADGDETYFKNVFREFLMVREQCGESSESISYDKFAQKLRKYREQLMLKPGVRSVRFQVYVKEGKAQVKASSVR
jgi:hypothetical protein